MSARSWTAPTLWRFGNDHEMHCAQNSLVGSLAPEAKSGKEQPQSKTLPCASYTRLNFMSTMLRLPIPKRQRPTEP